MRRKKIGIQFGSGYSWMNVRSIDEWITKLKRVSVKLEHIREEIGFDAIACSGSSGLVPAGALSIALQIPIIYVRKDKERSHGSTVESSARTRIRKYIILDDFVCSGNTVVRILKKINSFATQQGAHNPQCIGVFLYDCQGMQSEMRFDDQLLKIYR